MFRASIPALILAVFLAAAGCAALGMSADRSPELVIYSMRNERFTQPLLNRFTEETGITVRAFHLGEAAISRLLMEKDDVRADLLIANDAGAMEYLRHRSLLGQSDAAGAGAIDERFRAPGNAWIGLSARTRVLMYNRDMVRSSDLPDSLWELGDERWAGQFAITRGGNPSMIAHVSALRSVWGDDQVLVWLSRLKDNAGAIVRGHGDIRRAVGAGELAFGLVNDYYYQQQLREPRDNNVGTKHLDQESEGMGAFVNVAGVALVDGGPNPEEVREFLRWVLKPENVEAFSWDALEIPLHPEASAPEGQVELDSFSHMDVSLEVLGEYWEDTRRLIEASGLDLELR